MNLTEEQQKDVNERVEAFQKEYVELTVKHQVDFITYPQYIGNPDGSFSTKVVGIAVDKKYIPSEVLKDKVEESVILD